MRLPRLMLALLVAATTAGPLSAQSGPATNTKTAPLTLASQGSFFVGGETKTLTAAGRPGARGSGGGDITVNQMYVQYQIPLNGDRHVPVVMVHGCCLSSKTWETTPDGRMGWSEYFVRKDRPVYLADQVSRARSGFDPTAIAAVKAGTVPPEPAAEHPRGHAPGRMDGLPLRPDASARPFPDGQFPIEAVDELYKQMIPDLNSAAAEAESDLEEHGGAGGPPERRDPDGPLGIRLLPGAGRADRSQPASRASSRSRCRA